MINEAFSLLLALVIGILLGVIFFGGLWLTVQKVVSSKLSLLWLIGSMLLRTCTTIIGFHFIARGHWDRLLLCVLGFVIARFFMTRRVQEASHATQSR